MAGRPQLTVLIVVADSVQAVNSRGMVQGVGCVSQIDRPGGYSLGTSLKPPP